MTQQVVPRRRLRLLVNIRQIFRPMFIAPHRRNMPQPHLRAHFRRPRIVSHQNNLDVRMQLLPASNRIPLDDIDVPDKRLRRRKKRQHGFL